MKLDSEPRLGGVSPVVIDWARKVALVVNSLVDGLAAFAGFSVARSGTSGTAATIAPVSGGNGSASLQLNKVGATQSAALAGLLGGVMRWRIVLGDTTAESGSNAGSNFAIERYSDAGVLLGSTTLRRSDGYLTTASISAAGDISATGQGSFQGTAIQGNGAGVVTTNYGTSGTVIFTNVLNTAPGGFGNVLASQHDPGVFARWQMRVGATNFNFNNDGHATCIAWDSTSDLRVKTALEPITGALDRVAQLHAYTYERTDTVDDFSKVPRRHAGLIAQDVKAVLPEAVSVAPDELGTLSYEAAAVVALLVAAVNEQQVQFEALRAEIEILKGA